MSASISTPVFPTVTTSDVIVSAVLPSSSKEISAFVVIIGWHIGISSLVFLAAMIPATCATAKTSPLAILPA
ncbi:molybdenum cofactor biosynthesis protein MoaC [Listeria monocytogenes]|nr:molybdenum cofactor biosynthesis protein MoaC [Listeria monocytogenes]